MGETCRVDIDVQDRWGNTPLQDALRFNRTRTVALLKKHMHSNKQKTEFSEPVITEETEDGLNSRRSSSAVTVNSNKEQPSITITSVGGEQDASFNGDDGVEKVAQPDVLFSTPSSLN